MNNKPDKKKYFLISILVTLAVSLTLTGKVSAESCNVVHEGFPCTGKAIRDGLLTPSISGLKIDKKRDRVFKKGITLNNNKYYSLCSKYNHTAPPTNQKCTAKKWNTNDTKNKRIAAGMGALIQKAWQIMKKGNGVQWDDDLFVTNIAAHDFVYSHVTKTDNNTSNRYGSSNHKVIKKIKLYDQSLTAGESVYDNFNKNKISLSSSKITMKQNKKTGKYTINLSTKVTCKDDLGKKASCNLTQHQAKVKIDGKTSTLNLKQKNGSYVSGTITKAASKNKKIKVQAEFIFKNKVSYPVAQLYDCESKYQELIPSLIKNLSIQKKATAKVTKYIPQLPTPGPNKCEEVNGIYYGKNGDVLNNVDEYYKQCNPKCAYEDGTYYGPNGEPRGQAQFEELCNPKCEIDENGKYYDANGIEVREDVFNQQCNPKCAIEGDDHYGQDGNKVTEDEFNQQCNPKCEEVNGIYYGEDGAEVNPTAYKQQCSQTCDYIKVENTYANNPIEGSNIGLYTDNNCTNLFSTQVTAADGIAQFDNIDIDENKEYYYKGIESPTGYNFTDNSCKKINLENDCKTTTKIISEKKSGSITIKKQDKSGNFIDGAQVQIYTTEKVVDANQTSNTEDTIANGSDNDDPISESTDQENINVDDYEHQYIKFKEDGTPCINVTSDECKYDSIIVPKEGLKLKDLQPGKTYYVEEIGVLEPIKDSNNTVTGYEEDTDGNYDKFALVLSSQSVNIAYDKDERTNVESDGSDSYNVTYTGDDALNATVTITNHESSIYVCKVDAKTQKGLAGAHLRIVSNSQDQEKGEFADWTTTVNSENQYGCAEVTKLPDGDYYVEETSAPTGYTISNPITFTVKDGKLANNDDNILIVYNQHKIAVPNTLANNPLLTLTGMLITAGGAGTIAYIMRKNKPIKQSD